MSRSGPLRDFKLKACVDWVELRVEFSTPSQFHHVRRRMPSHWSPGWVQALERQASSRSFEFRVQDPDPANLMQEIRQLAPDPTVFDEAGVRITGVEIAIDTIPRNHQARDALPAAAAYLFRHHARPPAGTPRITAKGEYRAAARPRDVLGALTAGLTVNAGLPDATYRSRYYVKQFDTQDGSSYAPLKPHQYRARIEATLTGDHCPFDTIDEWTRFRFETLAEHFTFVRETPAATPFIALLREQLVQLGKPADPVKQVAHHRTTRTGTRRDTQLNQRVADALRALSRRTFSAGIHEVFQPRSVPPQRDER